MAEAQIMIVEDEALVALGLQHELIGLGYGVPAVVASGEEAVRKAGELRLDLVLMDVRLRGEMDGIAAAEQIYARFGIPVVYLSALPDSATRPQSESMHSFDHVSKPISKAQLHSAIETALREHDVEKKGP